VLSNQTGIPVTLPGKDEQYYWAQLGQGTTPQNGNYLANHHACSNSSAQFYRLLSARELVFHYSSPFLRAITSRQDMP